MWRRHFVSFFVFARELIADPAPVGAAAPSSKYLARRMASFVQEPSKSLVVELGAGTGAMTAGLLASGVPAANLVCVERSQPMANLLRDHYPGVTVIQGDATGLRELLRRRLGEGRAPVRHVVSSLPLLSLRREAVTRIMGEIRGLLEPGGRVIQFTYNLRATANPVWADLEHVHSSIVWFNLPPAKVDVFLRR